MFGLKLWQIQCSALLMDFKNTGKCPYISGVVKVRPIGYRQGLRREAYENGFVINLNGTLMD